MKIKTCLITGANRGIGLELVRQLLLSKKYSIIATSRDLAAARELQKLKQEFPQNLRLEVLDVTSTESAKALAVRLKDVPAIDLLVNNAGIGGSYDETFETITEASLIKFFKTNTVGPIRITQTLLPWVLKSEAPIVASLSSKMGSIADNTSGGGFDYRISKAALNMANKSFSIDYPKITAVVLHPGWVQTDMGGSNAPINAEKSVKGLVNVFENLSLKDSGKFYDFEGQEIPW